MDQSLIDQIRRANDIVEVIGDYLPLKHAGMNHRGLCPFHKDSNPSLNVSQSKQIFKCFACGKAGNVFGFVQEFEHLSFMEAVKKLAQRVGIAIPEYERTKTVSTKREQLLSAYKSAGEFYANNLFTHGKNVLDYLASRKLSTETAKNLQLGYALNSEKGLLNHLMKEGYGVAMLKESGLFGNYQGNLVDQFRERLMFPIHNSLGEIVAFSGRVMDANAPGGKYINSPGTELYTKGNELYGLFKTKYEIGKAKSAIVCEGNFDFLRLYESGFLNSVASLGTAFTEEQLYLLMRYTKHVNMLYDGDTAGIKAAVRSGLLCLSKGLEVTITALPKGQDPDTYILEEGTDALRELIDNSEPLISYLAGTKDLETPVAERIEQLMDSVRSVKDAVARELLVKDVSEAFGITEAALNSKLRQTTGARPADNEAAPPSVKTQDYQEERSLLVLSLKDAESFNLLASEITEDYFLNRLYRAVYRYMLENIRVDDIDEPSMILDNIENIEIKECLAELLFEDLQSMSFKQALKQVRIRKIQHQMDELDRMIAKEPQNLELLKQKESLSQMYRSMTSRVVKRVRL